MKEECQFLLAIVVALSVSGCAVGYNATLFMTKSNIGLDIDTKPPTAEISIARREAVIAPSFEGGQTLPVLASFRAKSNPFSRAIFGVKSTFAGGDAAVGLTLKGKDNLIEKGDSLLCLTKAPKKKKSFFGIDASVRKPGEVKPLFFGTDTSLGFKMAWSGMTGVLSS